MLAVSGGDHARAPTEGAHEGGSIEIPAGVRRRLAELAARWALSEDTIDRLAELLSFVGRDAHAPTTVRDPHVAVDIHIADSLTGLSIAEVSSARRIADIGSGAGFPGLPLALACPGASVALVESNARKADFIARAASAIGADNAEAVPSRAEQWHAGLATADVVTARALAPLPVLAEYAAPLLRLEGVLVAWKGRRDPAEEERAATAGGILGLHLEPPVPVEVGPSAEHRHLYVMRKVSQTPPRFPRRPGVASRRPLA